MPKWRNGRRARFRCVCRKTWRFESFLGHPNRLLIDWLTAYFLFTGVTQVPKMGSVENSWSIDYALLPNREWNQKQKHKKQPWSKMECFAFGGATVRFAPLKTSFHAANHTIPPPPSYEGYPLCPKDKNRSPFHGEKPLIVKWFLKKRLY